MRPRERAGFVRRLWLWSGLAFVLLAVAAAVRVADWSYGADTGTFIQIVRDGWGPMRNGVEQTTHYRFHWSPLLALLTPLLLVAGPWGGLVLQLITAAAAVACAPLLGALAGRLLPQLAGRIGAVALLYPPLVAVGFGEFRDLVLLTPLALGWLLALERRRWSVAGVLALAMALLREDVCLELLLIGGAFAVLAWRDGDRPRAGATAFAAAAGLVSVAIYRFAVLPRVGPWPPSHFYEYPFAHGPGALLLAPFTHPLAFFAAVLTFGRLTYLLEALIPLAFVPLRSRRALAALPGFAIVLLANSGLVWRMGMHYAALWIPWLLHALAAALARFRRPARWTNAILVLCAIALVFFSPLHPAHYLRPSYHALGDARRAFACVPADATVATHDEWYTALAATRSGIMVLGDDPPPARYLVVASDWPNHDVQTLVLPRVDARVRAGTYRAVCRFGNVAVYERASSSS